MLNLSSTRSYAKAISKYTIKSSLRDFKYAVRGSIAIRAAQIEKEMEAGVKYPFEKIIQMNIGNPQSLGQKPFTFNRQVLACMLTQNVGTEGYTAGARERAQ